MEKKTNRFYMNYLPVFILFVIIFKFIYQDNGLLKLFGIFVPILAGVFFSIVLNPLMKTFQKIFKLRIVAIILAYFLFISFLTMVAFIISPQIFRSTSEFIRDLPNIIARITELFRNPPKFFDFIEAKDAYNFYQNNIQNVIQKLTQVTSEMVNKTIAGVIDITFAFISFIMAIIISAYILWDKEHFENLYCRVVYSFFEKETSRQIIKFGRELNENVIKFIFGKIIDSLIIAIISYIGIKFVIKAQYPLILSLLIGISNMIPYFGPFIGGIPVIIITLLLDPIKGMWMTVFVFALQQFDGLILGPKILGIQLDLKPIWIIITIIIGGGLFGVWGMFFATPVAALLKTIISNYMEFRLKNQEFDLPFKK